MLLLTPPALADPDDLYSSQREPQDYDSYQGGHDSDDSSSEGRYHPPRQHFVYDAVAERTQQLLREGHENYIVNGVH